MTPAVLHHPADHPYVRRLPGVCRPFPVWDVEALASSAVRIAHVHFGFEGRDADELARWVRSCRSAGVRVVFTVHDVDNPHLVDQVPHHDAVRALAAAADAVVTLTEAAAVSIARLIDRPIVVLPHPHVVPLSRIAGRRVVPLTHGPVYVHAATCRPNLDVELVEQLAPGASRHGGLRVHVRTPLDERRRRVVERLAAQPGVVLDLDDRLSDTDLWSRIEDASAVLLPYRWGTHSGLLEAARDLATPVVAPDVGGLVEQGAMALDGAFDAWDRVEVRRPVTASERRLEHRELARRHRDLYRQVAES